MENEKAADTLVISLFSNETVFCIWLFDNLHL